MIKILQRPMNIIALLISAVIIGACATPATLYLSPGPQTIAEPADPGLATVLIHPFAEEFSANSQIGRHLITEKRQTRLLVEPHSISRALDALIHKQLSEINITAGQDGKSWDLTPEGLAAFSEPNQLLISGRIIHLSVNVEETLLSGKARAEMDIECILGLVYEKKVISRNVHVEKEMITFSFDQQDLEKMLAECLKEASKEVLTRCRDLLGIAPAKPQQISEITETKEKQQSPDHERIS